MRRDFDFGAGQPRFERLVEPCRIGITGTLGTRQARRSGADHADIESMLVFDLDQGAGQIDFAFDKGLRHIALLRRRRRASAVRQIRGKTGSAECKRRENRIVQLHASPPARSASGDLTREPGLRPSISLYHDIRLAVAIMMKMPKRLIAACTRGPPDHSPMMNCPANARNTPRQKISSECWPQRIAGCNSGDFNSGQS